MPALINQEQFGAKAMPCSPRYVFVLIGHSTIGCCLGTPFSNAADFGMPQRPAVTAYDSVTMYDGLNTTDTFSGGDVLVPNFLRVSETNWVEEVPQGGKRVRVDVRNSNFPDSRSLVIVNRGVADVTFNGDEILSSPDFTSLTSLVSTVGPNNVAGVSIRVHPPISSDKKYAADTSHIRLTRIRAALVRLGISDDLIGGSIEEGESTVPENTARVTISTISVNQEGK